MLTARRDAAAPKLDAGGAPADAGATPTADASSVPIAGDAGNAPAASGTAVAMWRDQRAVMRPTGSGRTLHVAVNGMDTNDGSAASPFRTVQKCADLAGPGDNCALAAGVYRETVRPRSGEPANPVSFVGKPGGKVVVSGTNLVTGWRASAGAPGVYEAQLPELISTIMNQTEQLFIDGKMVHLARWPNHGDDISRPRKSTLTKYVSHARADNWSTITFEDANLPAQPDGFYKGAEIFFQPNWGWSWGFSGEVVDHKGKQLTFRSRADIKPKEDGYPVGSRYFLFNGRGLMDENGEWWLDRTTKTLFLRWAANPASATVEIKARDYAFDLNKVNHVVIADLTVFGATITTDKVLNGTGVGYNEKGEPWSTWRAKDSMADSTGVFVDNVRAYYVSHFKDVSGHFFLQWGGTGIVLSGKDHVIQNSVVRFSAGNGITVVGRGHRVLNNSVLDTVYSAVDGAGITTGANPVSTDHEIGYNTVARTGRSCVSLRRLQNSDPKRLVSRVHHNDLSHCMLQDFDGGGVYTFGEDSRFVRLDHNWVHDMTGYAHAGLYVDFGKNYIMDHNVVWNTEWGILLQGEKDKVNNTILYNNTLVVANTSNSPHGPFGFAGGKTTNAGSFLQNNVVHYLTPNMGAGFMPLSGGYAAAKQDNNHFSNGKVAAMDPQFTDAAKGDFMLKPSSPAKGRGKPVPAQTYDGLTIPSFSDGGTDLGAFEKETPWQAGANVVEAP